MDVKSPVHKDFLCIGPCHVRCASFGSVVLHTQDRQLFLFGRQEASRLGEIREVEEDEDTK
jgi:hypothetical protein